MDNYRIRELIEFADQRSRDYSLPNADIAAYRDTAAALRELTATLTAAQQRATLVNPHTGEPRDWRDVNSDPAGVLCVEPGAPLLAAQQQGQAAARPSNCRNQLRDEGKAYPRSGCAVCKLGGLTVCPYERAAHAHG